MKWLLLLLLVGCGVSEQAVIQDSIHSESKLQAEVMNMKLSSPAFEHQARIPSKYTCDGDDISPPLKIEEIPDNTVTLALIVDDPDAPVGNWDHWIVWNIKPTEYIESGEELGVEGINDFKKRSYGGPCPPPGTHRYFFKLYALDTELSLAEGATKGELMAAMEGHILQKAELVGLYSRG